MTIRQQFKLSALAATVLLTLTACEADDGEQGAQGEQGPQGTTGAQGPQGEQGTAGQDGADGQDLTSPAKLTRVATVPVGAEITGMFLTDNDELFFNVQHPEDMDGNDTPAQVGFVAGLDWSKLDPMTADLAAPTTDAEKLAVRLVAGTFQVLGEENDTMGGDLPHGLGSIVSAADGTELKQSNDPDFNAFIATDAAGKEGFLYTAWEDRPGSMSRMEMSMQDDGTWSVTNTMDIDFSSVGGTMINCFGSLSPWGTPLTSEENYEAENTANWNNSAYTDGYPSYTDVKLLQDYNGGTFPNPYDYGYIVEITAPTTANPVPVKLFTLGRSAHENAVVMPDLKTVYTTDDGTNKAFYKFVADVAGDLSAGTLYAAKLTQDGTEDPAKAGFDIEWIELGSSDNTEIESWIDSYDGIDESDYVADSTNFITDAEIADWATNGTGDDRYAFLETLKAAEAKGATTEFRKMEGIIINYDGAASGTVPYMYVAMSEVSRGMTDDMGDIQLDDSAYCGVVYRFGLHADFDVTRMEPVVVGGAYNSEGDEHGNRCDVNGISNPDNVIVLDDGRVLIGEDTSKHTNNALWIYNPEGK